MPDLTDLLDERWTFMDDGTDTFYRRCDNAEVFRSGNKWMVSFRPGYESDISNAMWTDTSKFRSHEEATDYVDRIWPCLT